MKSVLAGAGLVARAAFIRERGVRLAAAHGGLGGKRIVGHVYVRTLQSGCVESLGCASPGGTAEGALIVGASRAYHNGWQGVDRLGRGADGGGQHALGRGIRVGADANDS